MAASETPAKPPRKRDPNHGRPVQFWAHTALIAHLQAYATANGCTPSQAAKRLLEASITR